MVRLAYHQDIPQVTQLLYNLKAQTAWALVEGEWNNAHIQQFLHEQLRDPRSVLYVWDAGTNLTAFCGCSTSRFYLPPHMPTMFEWGWAGPKRAATACWVACRAWAKKRGIHFACRVTGRPGSHARRIHEYVTWEVL